MTDDIIKNREISDDELDSVAGGFSLGALTVTGVTINTVCFNGKYQEGDPAEIYQKWCLYAQHNKKEVMKGGIQYDPNNPPAKGCCGSCKNFAASAVGGLACSATFSLAGR